MGSNDVRTIDCSTNPAVCVDEPLPEHLRTQTFVGLRWGIGASIGLGKGFQLGVTLPIQIKSFTIDHTLPDGSPYETPYSLLTGPSEVEVGLGDTEVMVRLVGKIPATPVLLSVGLGAALPTGRTSENPFDPALPASRRQHRQFGNGTVDPRVDVGLVVGTRPIGFIASGSARVPLYAGKFGYRGQRTIGGSFGVVASVPMPADALRLLLTADVSHASPAMWDGQEALNSGGQSLGVRMGFEYAIKPEVAVRASVVAMPLQTLNGEQFKTPVAVSVGLSGVIDVRPKKDKHGH